MLRYLKIILSVLLLFIVFGCESNPVDGGRIVSVNDEVLVELNKRGELPIAANSVEILDNVIEQLKESDSDPLTQFNGGNEYFLLQTGIKVKIIQIENEYVKLLILEEGYHNSEDVWTYKKYFEDYNGISVNDKVIIRRIFNGSALPVASKKQIFSTVTKDLEEGNTDSLERYMKNGDYLTLSPGTKVKIIQIDGEYSQFLVLEGRYSDKKFWTYKKYLEEY